ncbi:DNA repair protein RAD5B-like [Zingiber officinale]|uniref:DNA repair protein RAD5B-like n=1 Tax=Zingiber officinale TaxID=94328 RepID=UPI001C4A8F58|nr:DNA repair protein RAD5B-like [Zingiber officinale]
MEVETPAPEILLMEEIADIRSFMGSEISDRDILRALSLAGNNTNRAINILLDALQSSDSADLALNPVCPPKSNDYAYATTTQEPNATVLNLAGDGNGRGQETEVNEENNKENPKSKVNLGCRIENDVASEGRNQRVDIDIDSEEDVTSKPKRKRESVKELDEKFKRQQTTEQLEGHSNTKKDGHLTKESLVTVTTTVEESAVDNFSSLARARLAPHLNPRPISAIRPPGVVTDRNLLLYSNPKEPEFGEFPDEYDWLLVGKAYVNGLSTCRGRKHIDDGEIVHFSFPSSEKKKLIGKKFQRPKAAMAAAEIVRFSTKRSGEIGKLPPEWTRCLIPLVASSKVKILGKSLISAVQLSLMQEIVLHVSFYIHRSIFTEGCNFTFKLSVPSNSASNVHPLLSLFKRLRMKPVQRAEFTPEELDTRKKSLSLNAGEGDASVEMIVHAKRVTGDPGQSSDEQAISESSLNKIVGTSDEYDLEEAMPPSTLCCALHPYQKQALYWMCELEKGTDFDKATKSLHPCWAAYRIYDKRASEIYVNVFTGESTTQFPSAMQMARGGILADAMGLGKTVMTIALILARINGERPYDNGYSHEHGSNTKGGTLIVCPMALLGQWKDELETHSKPGSFSVYVYYGGSRMKASDIEMLARYDVVLTTYGVLSSAYRSDSVNASIFNNINWYRVVLDEAHNIKCSKTKVAQSAFALNAYCRWCLTGTPLQNKLEDLYSLLCFLHVEPWCNWVWWNSLIQTPYDMGDVRGLKLVKAILRSLMLRRTKDTRDKEGRPILVLPPAHIQVVECEQSEAERDFYEALFTRSKVKFDKFVEQGKVLHNYASILELLLRLRQCCNHPYLVMSRGQNQENTDLNKLVHRFLGGPQSNQAPTRAYVEEVVEGLRRGEVTECPICLESASDDPVLTPCAHRMCRECLLASWSTPVGGPCPICRRALTKEDLITCPNECRFQIDIEENWTESSKVKKLMECLENIKRTGEKSIIFSQWTGFLDLLEIALRGEFGFLRFDGKLNQQRREYILKEFNESKDKTVLLMSLKAGGVGLNLTAASNVFIMDPWWNPAVEEQAIMRIHRIGQKRQVRVTRFIVKDTVEERMQQVQARKQRMISGALTDEEVRSARIEELKMLFR